MTRFALIAIALFTSACAADVNGDVEEANDDFRAAMEDIELDEETARSAGPRDRVLSMVMTEYGPLAKEYGCDIAGVVVGTFSSRGAPVRGYMLNLDAERIALFQADMQWDGARSGSIHVNTVKSRLNDSEYVIDGIFDRNAIEADFMAQSNEPGVPDYHFIADWSRRGAGGLVKGVVANCNA